MDSLRSLGRKEINSFMVHNPGVLKTDKGALLIDWLDSLKIRGLVKYIGISIYDSSDLHDIELDRLDIVQLPLSLYDQRLHFDKTTHMLRERNILIQLRSIFLQGLIFMDRLQIISLKHLGIITSRCCVIPIMILFIA